MAAARKASERGTQGRRDSQEQGETNSWAVQRRRGSANNEDNRDEREAEASEADETT